MPSSEKAKKKILKENYFDVFLEGFVCLVIYWQEQSGTRRGQKEVDWNRVLVVLVHDYNWVSLFGEICSCCISIVRKQFLSSSKIENRKNCHHFKAAGMYRDAGLVRILLKDKELSRNLSCYARHRLQESAELKSEK